LKTDNGLGIEQVPVVGIAGYALALRGLKDRAPPLRPPSFAKASEGILLRASLGQGYSA